MRAQFVASLLALPLALPCCGVPDSPDGTRRTNTWNPGVPNGRIVFFNNYSPEAVRVFRPKTPITPFQLATPATEPDAATRDKHNGAVYAAIIHVVRDHRDQLVFDYRVDARIDKEAVVQQRAQSELPQLEFYPLLEDEGLSPAGKVMFGEAWNTVRLIQAYHFKNEAGKKTYVPIEGGGILVHLAADGAIVGFDSHLVPPPIDISSKDSKVDQRAIERYRNYKELQQLRLDFESLHPRKTQVELLKSRILLGIPGPGDSSPTDLLPPAARPIFDQLAFTQMEDQPAYDPGYSKVEEARARKFIQELGKAKNSLVFATEEIGSEGYHLAWKVEAPFGLPLTVYLRAKPQPGEDLVLKTVPTHIAVEATGHVQVFNGLKSTPRGDGVPVISNVAAPLPQADVDATAATFSALYEAWKGDRTLFPDPDKLETANHIGWLGTRKVLDFYMDGFGWDGFDGSGSVVDVSVNASDLSGNAHYSRAREILVFGVGGYSQNPFIYDLGILGHEFTHGVVRHTAALYYGGQSGAINEHLADLFGVAFKSFALGIRNNYTIGDIVSATTKGTPRSPIRDMLNKSNNRMSWGYPDSMESVEAVRYLRRCSPRRFNDYCGVHYLSAIPSKAAALSMAEFQSTHDAALDPAEAGTEQMHAGWRKFLAIAWDALTTRLGRYSTLREYRNAMVDSCRVLASEGKAGLSAADCEVIAKNFDSVGLTEEDTWDVIRPGEADCTISISGDTVNVRDAPSTRTGEILTALHDGFKIKSLGLAGAWHEVRFEMYGERYGGNGDNAYIYGKYVKCGATEDPYKVIRPSGVYQDGELLCKVTASNLNVRNLPTTAGSIIYSVLPEGHRFIGKKQPSSQPWMTVEYVFDGVLHGASEPAKPHWLHGGYAECVPPS